METFDSRVREQLGRRVRRRRRAIDMTQEELAHRAGIHRTQISLIEKGVRLPLTSTLIRLAAGLGVSVDQLVVGIEWKVPGPDIPGLDGGDPGA